MLVTREATRIRGAHACRRESVSESIHYSERNVYMEELMIDCERIDETWHLIEPAVAGAYEDESIIDLPPHE